MIHYHGMPLTPESEAVRVVRGRHMLVSYVYPEQLEELSTVCSSFVLDNGAFSVWKRGGSLDVSGYYAWVKKWYRHPAFDWAIIPDVIEGTEVENMELISAWTNEFGYDASSVGVPVWHMHESLDRLLRLSQSFPRIAIGSSGMYDWTGHPTPIWWFRMNEAMEILCDELGRPYCKIHGLRMQNPDIFTRFPFSSTDSAYVSLSVGLDNKWKGPNQPKRKSTRGIVLADNVEMMNSAPRWHQTGVQEGLDLTDGPTPPLFSEK